LIHTKDYKGVVKLGISSILKKENIKVVRQLNSEEVNILSRDIAIKLCLAFPEHNLNRQDLSYSFSSLNMYLAELGDDSSGAKYLSQNNSIYFNKDIDFDKIPDVAMHECIHFIQSSKISENKRMGIYNFRSGLALNEAGVQIMASEANMSNISEEKYFDIFLKTNSPNYYPLECALLNQMAYFTGTFPLYHSIINSDDIFKNTFISKFNKRIYNIISNKLDKLLHLETELNYYIYELQYADNIRNIKSLNKLIQNQKSNITKLFYEIQNFIIENCFICEFNSIRNLEDLTEFKFSLYNFKELIGHDNNYNFYNNFYCDMMNKLETKKEEVEKFGEISLFEDEVSTALAIIPKTKYAFKFANTFIYKLKKLFRANKSEREYLS